jgi:PIN domain nuclease of toxin-antitoxin system
MPIGSSRGEALLLDTHVWLWVLEGTQGKLSRRCLRSIDAAARAGRVWVSAISVWEVAMLDSMGRIALSMDCPAWVDAALRKPGINLIDLLPTIAVASTRLPGAVHGDPADRILISSARHLAAAIVSVDREIIRYGKSGHVNVLDARA